MSLRSTIHLDKFLRHPTRFAVVAHLAHCDGTASFLDTCAALNIDPAGSLSFHVRTLENGGYLKTEKTFANRRPRTWLQLTDAGRTALARHKEALAALLGNAG
jgi:DNA-binding MarR family transcriptional regulator